MDAANHGRHTFTDHFEIGQRVLEVGDDGGLDGVDVEPAPLGKDSQAVDDFRPGGAERIFKGRDSWRGFIELHRTADGKLLPARRLHACDV